SAYVAAPSAYVSALDVTAGSLNFAIPKGVDPTHYHSLVIWCQLLHSAYGAATLVPTKAAHTAKPSQTKPAHAKQAQAKATSTPTTKAG
ncbi:MAG: hypothetical protein ACRDX8_14040, partial [Acidimicrobiales bacterium]